MKNESVIFRKCSPFSRLAFCFAVLYFSTNADYSIAQEKTYSKPALADQNSWSLILLPDPQAYVKFGRNQPILDLMTSWISENISQLNIQTVLCTGDLVDKNELAVPDGLKANQSSVEQWKAVSSAFSKMDGKVSYVTATGNHDYGIFNFENRKTSFDQYFPINKNPKNREVLRHVGLNADGRPTLENAAYEFFPPNGKKILAISLEYLPRNEIVQWAKELVDSDVYSNHLVILLTHFYLGSDNNYLTTNKTSEKNWNDGADLWNKLVKPAKNIQLVLAGHIGKPDDPKGHIGFRQDKNSAGKNVAQMAFNAQGLGGGFDGNGGDGWLRILEFLPDNKSVYVRTFSPLFATSPSTNQLSWREAEYDEFTFRLD